MIYAILFWFGSLLCALAALSGLPGAACAAAIVTVVAFLMWIRLNMKVQKTW